MSSDSPQVYVGNLKLVLLGESSVGKTSIVTRYTTGNYQKTNATIGAAFLTKTINLPIENGVAKKLNMEIWDTAGQERYRSLTPIYYRNTDAALVVFDVTKPESLRKAQSWIDELHEYCNKDRPEESIHVVLVGNKADLEYEAPDTEQHYVAVSAKTGDGIIELFENLAKSVPAAKFVKQEATEDTTEDPFKISRKKSCSC